MSAQTEESVAQIAANIGINIDKAGIDQKSLFRGYKEELEHGQPGPVNVTDGDPVKTTKIALAHLLERPDYYDNLAIAEKAPSGFWQGITSDRFWKSARLGALIITVMLLLAVGMVVISHLNDDLMNMAIYGVIAVLTGLLAFLHLGAGISRL